MQVRIRTRPKMVYDSPTEFYEHKLDVFCRNFVRHTQPNRELLLRYAAMRRLDVRTNTLLKDLQFLNRLFMAAVKPLGCLDSVELAGLLTRMHGTAMTMNCYKTALANFYKWLGQPEKVAFLKYERLQLRRDPYVTLADVKKLLACAESLEEKAFFSLMWEGDLRSVECWQLRRSDVEVFPKHILLYIDGKTGQRTVPILRKGTAFPLGSYGCFLRYIAKAKPQGKLWSLQDKGQVEYRLRKLKQKAGLPYFHLHILRKSRFTYNNEIGLPYAINCAFGGWVPESRVTKGYMLAYGQHLIPTLERYNDLLIGEAK